MATRTNRFEAQADALIATHNEWHQGIHNSIWSMEQTLLSINADLALVAPVSSDIQYSSFDGIIESDVCEEIIGGDFPIAV